VSVSQVRSPLVVPLGDGGVKNTYSFSFLNKTRTPAKLTLSLEGLEGAYISLGEIEEVIVPADDSRRFLIKVIRHKNEKNVQQNIPFRFKVTPIAGDLKESVFVDSQFITYSN
jgi:polyferredoxin